MAPAPARRGGNGLQLGLLILNQLLAGVGVATGMALAAILVTDLTGSEALAGLAQSGSVLGAAVTAVPLARLAVRSGRHVALATGYAFAVAGAVLVLTAPEAAVEPAPAVQAGVVPLPGGAAVSMEVTF